MNFDEALEAWQGDKPFAEEMGIQLRGVLAYLPDEFRRNFELAADQLGSRLGFDALPALTTDPNSAIPALLTTVIDPEITRVLFTPNKAADIFGEKMAGNWTEQTRLFPVVEHTGEVSSYGDYSENGRAGVNADWPNRQAYLFQLIKEYGELELERAGLAKLNWVSEIDQAGVLIINKYLNFTYFFGVAGLQNYGLLNDPNLPASLTPAVKGYGGTKWIVNNQVLATANEVFNDIQSLYSALVNQVFGLVEADSPMTLALSPASEVALTATNTFNVNVHDILKKNFPNIKVKTAAQYGQSSTSNSQGIAAGNFVQLLLDDVDGQDVGYCAYNQKLRSFPIVRDLSSYKQKVAAGTWGSIIRVPAGISSMVGI